MTPLRRVMVLAAPDMRETLAMQRGMELARLADAELYLFLCVFDPVVDAAHELANAEVQELARTRLLEQRSDWLYRTAAALVQRGLRVQAETLWGEPGDDMPTTRIAELRPDLVIADYALAAHGRRLPHLSRAQLRLVRRCPAPLMLVRPDSALLPKRMLAGIGIDAAPSAAEDAHNERIVGDTLRLARYCNAEASIVHVFAYRRPPAGVPLAAGLRHLHRAMRGSVQERFDALARHMGVPAESAHWIDARHGEAVGLLAHAKVERTDLLVVGTGRHSGLHRLFIGSVAEDVLRAAKQDMLLVNALG